MTLPAFATERGHLHEISIHSGYAAPAPAAVDRYILPAGRSAANPPHAAAAVDRTDRQTDGRTDTRPLHRPRTAHYADSVNEGMVRRHRFVHEARTAREIIEQQEVWL